MNLDDLRPWRVGAAAAAAALLVCVVMLINTVVRVSPGGSGESYEWLMTWLLILGFPSTLLVASIRSIGGPPAMALGAMILAVIVTWFAVGIALGMLLRLARRLGRARPETPTPRQQ